MRTPYCHYPPTSHSSLCFLCLPDLLLNGLVAVAVVPLLAIGEEPIDDDTADREDEDEDRPQELVADRAARLKELDYARVSTLYMGKMR